MEHWDIEFRPFCNPLNDEFSNHEINMKLVLGSRIIFFLKLPYSVVEFARYPVPCLGDDFTPTQTLI